MVEVSILDMVSNPQGTANEITTRNTLFRCETCIIGPSVINRQLETWSFNLALLFLYYDGTTVNETNTVQIIHRVSKRCLALPPSLCIIPEHSVFCSALLWGVLIVEKPSFCCPLVIPPWLVNYTKYIIGYWFFIIRKYFEIVSKLIWFFLKISILKWKSLDNFCFLTARPPPPRPTPKYAKDYSIA